MPEFDYTEILPIDHDHPGTEWRLVTSDGVEAADGIVHVEPDTLRLLTREAFRDISHLLRPGHLQQLRNILDDPEASPNDRFVATDLLKNACIAAGGVLPMCQDTGTAIVMGKKGERVLTGGRDEEAISGGVFDAYTQLNLRYSQMAPLSTWDEVNTGTNLPAQIDISSVAGDRYELLFMAKGGGSANKSLLFQETKALLTPERLMPWLDEKLRTLGTAACPPYHLALVIGGTSAEYTLKVAKLASARYLDTLPTDGSSAGACDPRSGAGGVGARAHPALRHRGAVRREVLLPRRARRPPARATARRARSRSRCRARPTARRWRASTRSGVVARAARDRPGPLPPRGGA